MAEMNKKTDCWEYTDTVDSAGTSKHTLKTGPGTKHKKGTFLDRDIKIEITTPSVDLYAAPRELDLVSGMSMNLDSTTKSVVFDYLGGEGAAANVHVKDSGAGWVDYGTLDEAVQNGGVKVNAFSYSTTFSDLFADVEDIGEYVGHGSAEITEHSGSTFYETLAASDYTAELDTTGDNVVVTVKFKEKTASDPVKVKLNPGYITNGELTDSKTDTVKEHSGTYAFKKPAANTIKYGTTILGVAGTLLEDRETIPDADTAQVRTGYEFWNHDGERKCGSMPDSTIINPCPDSSHSTIAATITPSTSDQYVKITQGYIDENKCIKVDKMTAGTIIIDESDCVITAEATLEPIINAITKVTDKNEYQIKLKTDSIITDISKKSHSGGELSLASTTVAGYITKDSTITKRAGHTDTVTGKAVINASNLIIPGASVILDHANCTIATSATLTPVIDTTAITKVAGQNKYKLNLTTASKTASISKESHSGGTITLKNTTTEGYITKDSTITVAEGHEDTVTGNAVIDDSNFTIDAGSVQATACTVTPDYSGAAVSGTNYKIPVSVTSMTFTTNSGYVTSAEVSTAAGIGTAEVSIRIYDGTIA